MPISFYLKRSTKITHKLYRRANGHNIFGRTVLTFNFARKERLSKAVILETLLFYIALTLLNLVDPPVTHAIYFNLAIRTIPLIILNNNSTLLFCARIRSYLFARPMNSSGETFLPY